VSVDKARRDLALLGENYCAEPEEYTRAWNITQRIFAKLKEDVEAHGAKLVVFDVPPVEEVSLQYMEDVAAKVEHPEKLCLEQAPSQSRLSNMLNKLHIDFIPLLSDFRKVTRQDGIQLYHADDLHWNPKGHALAARLVVSELIKRALLPQP
jgi:hypothetical protein